MKELVAFQYQTKETGDFSRYFRLDIQRSDMEVYEFKKGTTDWIFFSTPITPQNADPFVNLGDDIDPFKLYQYDSDTNGYKIYPLDIGEMALQPGQAYFTILEQDVAQVDIGGTINHSSEPLSLENPGWHAIGNPLPKAVTVSSLKANDVGFKEAVSQSLIEGTLYTWGIESGEVDRYRIVSVDDQLLPWRGSWIRTLKAGIKLSFTSPDIPNNYVPSLPDRFIPPMGPAKALASDAAAGFELKFELTSDMSSDTTTRLGTHEAAKLGWDRMDQSEPPRLKHTVSAYFHHSDWPTSGHSDFHDRNGTDSTQRRGIGLGRYNHDFQSLLEIDESRQWELVTYYDQPGDLKLSWAGSVESIPEDTMIYFRHRGANTTSSSIQLPSGHSLSTIGSNSTGWQDMRQVKTVSIDASKRITKQIFEIRAEKFQITPPTDFQITPGEAEAKLSWSISDNPFIANITITRQFVSSVNSLVAREQNQSSHRPITYKLAAEVREFIDYQVEEEATYRYQVGVRFKSGAMADSGLLETTVLPTIQFTRLMANYPNPFNPETWFPYELENEANVSIGIHNSSGR